MHYQCLSGFTEYAGPFPAYEVIHMKFLIGFRQSNSNNIRPHVPMGKKRTADRNCPARTPPKAALDNKRASSSPLTFYHRFFPVLVCCSASDRRFARTWAIHLWQRERCGAGCQRRGRLRYRGRTAQHG